MNRKFWISGFCLLREKISDGNLNWLKQKKFLKVMDLPARRALQAVRNVWEISGDHDGKNTGVVVGIEQLDSGLDDWEEARALGQRSTGRENLSEPEIGNYLAPLALIHRLPNTIAGHLAREFSATGPCWTSGGKDAMGLEEIVQGLRWLADGECDRVIVARVEPEAVMTMILQQSAGDGRGREILSWSFKNSEDPGAGENVLKLSQLDDWSHWENASQLQGGSGVRIVLRPR